MSNDSKEQERELFAIWHGKGGGNNGNRNNNTENSQAYIGPPIILEIMKHLSSQERIQVMMLSRAFADVFRGFYRKDAQRTHAVRALLSFVLKHGVTVAFTLTKPGEVDLMMCFTTFHEYYDHLPRLAIYTQDQVTRFPCPSLLRSLNDFAKSKGFTYNSQLVENNYMYRGDLQEASWAWLLNFDVNSDRSDNDINLDDDAALAVIECLDMVRQSGYKETMAGTFDKEPGLESMSSPNPAKLVESDIGAAAERVFERLNFYRVKLQVNNTNSVSRTNTVANATVDADERYISILQGIVARAKLAQDSTGLLNSKTAQFLHETNMLNPVINAARNATLDDLKKSTGSQGAGLPRSPKIKYHGKAYTVRVGKRGGRYILVQGEKIYIHI